MLSPIERMLQPYACATTDDFRNALKEFPGANFEVKYQLNPVAYSVRLYDKPSLFAGKLHALICRKWKNRVKGRDFMTTSGI